MTVARIVEEQRKTTQSGKAKAGRWTLEFERQQPQRPDPLTGWSGSGDTNTQVRLTFDSRDAALAYAERKGLTVHVVPAPPVPLKIQAYADNFR
jgi:ETC complex I subunit-like protein